MGAWGYGIFESDMAAAVKHEFEEFLGEGLNVEEATAAILVCYAEELDDFDDGPEITFALAALQLERQALQPSFRERAIELIDSGETIDRWIGPEHQQGRAAALQEFRSRLVGSA